MKRPLLLLAGASAIIIPFVAMAQDALPLPSEGVLRQFIGWLAVPGDELLKALAMVCITLLAGLFLWTRRPAASDAGMITESLKSVSAALVEVSATMQMTAAHIERLGEEQRETVDHLQRLAAVVQSTLTEVRAHRGAGGLVGMPIASVGEAGR